MPEIFVKKPCQACNGTGSEIKLWWGFGWLRPFFRCPAGCLWDKETRKYCTKRTFVFDREDMEWLKNHGQEYYDSKKGV